MQRSDISWKWRIKQFVFKSPQRENSACVIFPPRAHGQIGTELEKFPDPSIQSIAWLFWDYILNCLSMCELNSFHIDSWTPNKSFIQIEFHRTSMNSLYRNVWSLKTRHHIIFVYSKNSKWHLLTEFVFFQLRPQAASPVLPGPFPCPTVQPWW